jgi:hypothetical protein
VDPATQADKHSAYSSIGAEPISRPAEAHAVAVSREIIK